MTKTRHTSLLTSKGAMSLLATTFLFGIFGVLSRLIGYALPLYYITAMRSLITSGILLVMMMRSGTFRTLASGDLGWVMVRSIAGMVGVIGFFVAVNAVPLGTAYFVLYVGILVTGFVSGRAIFGEKLLPVHYVSLAIAIAGLWLLYDVIVGAAPMEMIGMLLVSGIGASLWNGIPKKISAVQTSESLAFWDNLLGALMVFVYSAVAGERWVAPQLSSVWGYNLLFSLCMVATGQLVVFGFRHIDVHIGNIIMLGEVIFGVLFGWLLYHEAITLRMAAGGFLIVIAMALPDIRAVIREGKRL